MIQIINLKTDGDNRHHQYHYDYQDGLHNLYNDDDHAWSKTNIIIIIMIAKNTIKVLYEQPIKPPYSSL